MLPQFSNQQALQKLMDMLPKVTLEAGTTLYLYPSPTSAVREISAAWPVGLLREEHFQKGKWPLLSEDYTPVLTEDSDHHDHKTGELVVRYYPGVLHAKEQE